MKRLNDYPDYEEHKTFRLNNLQRPYFGLDMINDKWQEVEIKEGTTVFYEGNIIKKVITWENRKHYEYTEFDTEIVTRERSYILPKTSRGKEKKITPTNLRSFMATGCQVYISLKKNSFNSNVIAWKPKNNIHLPITDYEGLDTIAKLEEWLDNYINTCPPDYFEKVEKMRTLPHRTIKYKIGDIFRFEIDREYYGFGLIIGKLRELDKLNVLSEDHPLKDILSVPILIRVYKIRTKDKNMPIDEVIKNKLLATDIVSDGEIIWGTHDIIGNKQLEVMDVDFPLQYGFTLNATRKRILRLAWGIGMIKIDNFEALPKELQTNIFLNHGIALSIPIYKLNKVLDGESEYSSFSDLRHPDNKEFRNKLFKALNLPLDIDIDYFNELNNGMTRTQYIDFITR